MATTSNAARQAGLKAHITGLKEARAAFQALPDVVRENMLDAVTVTVREIARGAQARLQASPSIDTRALHDAVGWRVTKTNGRGRVGILNTPAVGDGERPSRRAHFIEFGTRKMEAEPFMIPAAEAEKEHFRQRAVKAGKGIERDMAVIGLRNR